MNSCPVQRMTIRSSRQGASAIVLVPLKGVDDNGSALNPGVSMTICSTSEVIFRNTLCGMVAVYTFGVIAVGTGMAYS